MNDIASDKARLFTSDTALTEDLGFAFLVFSLVRFLGILFSLPAIIIYAVGTSRNGDSTGKKLTAASIFVFAVQLFLWSLLYLVPQLPVSTV